MVAKNRSETLYENISFGTVPHTVQSLKILQHAFQNKSLPKRTDSPSFSGLRLNSDRRAVLATTGSSAEEVRSKKARLDATE